MSLSAQHSTTVRLKSVLVSMANVALSKKNEKMTKEKSIEKKLKLLPTLREKRHYLVIKPKSKQEMSEKELHEKIDKAILDFIGIFGYAKAGPLFIEVKRNYVIVSITTKYVKSIKAALALSDLECVGVSGAIKKVRRFI